MLKTYNNRLQFVNAGKCIRSRDIEASQPDGRHYALEVKYIGQEDWDFVDISESLERGGVGKGRAVSPYAAADFALFKVYSAAKQLQAHAGLRSVILVISELTWHRFQVPLAQNWINWKNPRFFNNDTTWTDFFEKQKRRYPNIEQDVAGTIGLLTKVWILRQEHGFHYANESSIDLRLRAQ